MSSDVKNWSANQRKFQMWLAIPTAMRDPHTQGELARSMGITDATLSRWKHWPGFAEEVAKLSRQFLKDDLPDIFGALIREAKNGSYQHIKLALEVAGEHTDEVNVNVADRRAAIAKRLAAIAEEEQGQNGHEASVRALAPNLN